jgi:hypothetical protein
MQWSVVLTAADMVRKLMIGEKVECRSIRRIRYLNRGKVAWRDGMVGAGKEEDV